MRLGRLVGATAAQTGGGKDLGITVLAVTYLVISEEDCKESDKSPSFQKRVKSMVDTDFHNCFCFKNQDLVTVGHGKHFLVKMGC